METRISHRESKAHVDGSQSSLRDIGINFDDTIDLGVVRIASKKAMSFWMTPLVIPAIELFTKNVQSAVREVFHPLKQCLTISAAIKP